MSVVRHLTRVHQPASGSTGDGSMSRVPAEPARPIELMGYGRDQMSVPESAKRLELA
jgi:hypothetical protein